MFNFDFDIEDSEDSQDLLNLSLSSIKIQETFSKDLPGPELEPFSEISLQQLVDSIPDQISYSPISIPLSSSRKVTTLIRRDLFDARFQLISEGAGDAADDDPTEESNGETKVPDLKAKRQALSFLDAPSDLVPGVYEGGLKTWECSLDIVDYLDSLKESSATQRFSGEKILEVGCGTGVPSMFIFHELLSSISTESPTPSKTQIHLQDYNPSVLQLVTLPNLLLTWYTSHYADSYRSTTNDSELAPIIDPQNAGELQITAELKSAFLQSLKTLNISLRFFSGSWNTFDPLPEPESSSSSNYTILLTSETIYRNESLRSLIGLMRKACIGEDNSASTADSTQAQGYLCLVAAKVLYFGVGGGVSDFLAAVEGENGQVETVFERNVGVGRKIMKVHWNP